MRPAADDGARPCVEALILESEANIVDVDWSRSWIVVVPGRWNVNSRLRLCQESFLGRMGSIGRFGGDIGAGRSR